jgi:DNA repair photolyase
MLRGWCRMARRYIAERQGKRRALAKAPADPGSSNPLVDVHGKLTISLGGFCPLQCKHCYTTVPNFSQDPKRTVEAALEILESVAPELKVICLSGDTDPFLRPNLAIDFLERAAREYPNTDLMYTTRLIPRRQYQEQLIDFGNSLAARGQLCVPAVSLITATYPNNIEDPSLVPSSIERLAFLSLLATSKQPAMLALRPTFPFEIVPRAELDKIVSVLDPRVSVILGETFLLDDLGVITRRVGLKPNQECDRSEPLTFMNQPTNWYKRRYPKETQYMAELAALNQRNYFTRSISALRYFHSGWSLSEGRLNHDVNAPIDTSAECLDP